MIKIFKTKVRIKGEHRLIYTIGVEDEAHNLITWKPWVGFSPEYSFFHARKLQSDYALMDVLLKVATYSAVKRGDGVVTYEASIIDISPYMLEFLAGCEGHTVANKMAKLSDMGYITYTSATKGSKPRQTILLNQYTNDNLKVFTIEKSWLMSSYTTDKDGLILEAENWKTYHAVEGGEATFSIVDALPIAVSALTENIHPNKQRVVANLPIDDAVALTPGTELPDDLPQYDTEGFEGAADALMGQVAEIAGTRLLRSSSPGASIIKSQRHTKAFDSLRSSSVFGEKNSGSDSRNLSDRGDFPQVDISELSTLGQTVAVYYERETGLKLTKADVGYIDELLKISALNQIISAIKSCKVWRAGYPANFEKLSESEKKQCIIKSQPGYLLKQYGLKHVHSFVSSSVRFRKDGFRKNKGTGVVSGLDEQKNRERQKKLLDEVREKQKAKKAAEGAGNAG